MLLFTHQIPTFANACVFYEFERCYVIPYDCDDSLIKKELTKSLESYFNYKFLMINLIKIPLI